ncbi:MAG: T9SS type A sorting domain-containing protein [Cyclobacteriaceae bacterium]
MFLRYLLFGLYILSAICGFSACPNAPQVGGFFTSRLELDAGSDATDGNDVCAYDPSVTATGAVTVALNETVTFYGNVTIQGDMTIYGNLVIYGTLTIQGDLTIDADAMLDVQPTAELNVVNVNNAGFWTQVVQIVDPTNPGTSGSIAGTINVSGNFDNNDGGNMTVADGGELNVGGTFTNEGGSTITVEDGGALDAGTFTDNGGTQTIAGADVDCVDNGCCGACSASGNSVVPVELVDFMAELDVHGYCVLEWTTATETNNEGFFVERAFSVKNEEVEYKEIGFVEGNGTASELINYRFVDYAFSGDSYYRLRQVDFDGTTEYSPAVYLKSPVKERLSVYPNPVITNQVTVRGIRDIVGYSIYDLKGGLIDSYAGKAVDATVLENQILQLNQGDYLLNVHSSLGSFKSRIIKD